MASERVLPSPPLRGRGIGGEGVELWKALPLTPGPSPRSTGERGASGPADARRFRRARQDPLWVRLTLTTVALLIVGVLIVVPVANVFAQAFANGVPAYFEALVGDRATRSAILLTLTVAPIAVALNVVFGVAAAWAIARFRFPGRTLLLTLIDLPFSVSPVVAGLVFVLLFGLQGYFGVFLRHYGQPTLATLLILALTAVGVPLVRRRRNDGFRLILAALTLLVLLVLGDCLFFWGPDVIMQSGRVEQSGTPAEVFEHPANAFVMDFLGNVNVFHGRVQDGVATLGGLEVPWPDYPHAEPREAKGYVRPHELDVERSPNGAPAVQARVVHVNTAGAVTRVRLRTSDAEELMHVEVSQLRSAELNLRVGETVFLAPRKVRVFTPDYSI